MRRKYLAGALGILALLLAGCEKDGTEQAKEEELLAVSLVDSVFYTAKEQTARVPFGEDVSFSIELEDGFRAVSCSYPDYTLTETESGAVLVLHGITEPMRVTLNAEKEWERQTFPGSCARIRYDLNGAVYEGEREVQREYSLTNHLRPNTWNGKELKRPGYTLTGWNTRADGSGEHIGLGSRVTAQKDEVLSLYAEWEKWVPEEELLYEAMPDHEIRLTGYRGDGRKDPFVIPEYIGGLPVTEIAASFTANLKCGRLEGRTLVLPSTVKRVRDGAFWNTDFRELCLWDSVEEITEKAFPEPIATYHINAELEPAFLRDNNSSFYADGIDQLMLSEEGRRLVLFGGCSFDYGVDSAWLERALGQSYDVINLGVNGDIDAAFQMDILEGILGEGDLLIHAPEEMSTCQLMGSHYLNNIAFIMTEGNYDLMSCVDFSENEGFLSAFTSFLELKRRMPSCSYEDSRWGENFSRDGDYMEPRIYDEATESARDTTYSDYRYGYAEGLLTEAGMDELGAFYQRLEENGVQVMISYAPVNEHSGERTEEVHREAFAYAEKFEEMLDERECQVISRVEDYLYPGRYFYDSDYHLNEVGAMLRTRQLYRDLVAAGL